MRRGPIQPLSGWRSGWKVPGRTSCRDIGWHNGLATVCEASMLSFLPAIRGVLQLVPVQMMERTEIDLFQRIP